MYGKIFEQMYNGTLAMVGPWEALVTFQQMIVIADKDGVVDMTADAISRRTTIPLPIIQKGITALEQPDPESRSPDEEGRRIVLLTDGRNWGWRIVNHEYYRKLRSEDERRDYHRQYWHKRKGKPGEMEKIRARRKANNAITAGKLVQEPCEVCGQEEGIEAHHDDYTRPLEVRWLCKRHHTDEHFSTAPQLPSNASTDSTHTVSSKQKAVSSKQKKPMSAAPTSVGPEVERIFDHWKTTHNHPQSVLNEKRRKLIRDRLKEYDEATLCQAITGYLNSPHHTGDNPRDTKYDAIELLLRDAKHVDMGLKFYREPPRAGLSEKTRRIINQTAAWEPPELRRANNGNR